MGIRNPNASTLRPVKNRFLISVSVQYPNNHFEKYFYLLFTCLQLSNQKRLLFLARKNIWVRALPHCVPKVTPTVVIF